MMKIRRGMGEDSSSLSKVYGSQSTTWRMHSEIRWRDSEWGNLDNYSSPFSKDFWQPGYGHFPVPNHLVRGIRTGILEALMIRGTGKDHRLAGEWQSRGSRLCPPSTVHVWNGFQPGLYWNQNCPSSFSTLWEVARSFIFQWRLLTQDEGNFEFSTNENFSFFSPMIMFCIYLILYSSANFFVPG